MNRRQKPSITSFMLGALVLSGAAIAVGAAAVAVAQGKVLPGYSQLVKEGEAIAQRLCVGCHVVEGGSSGSTVPAGLPSMRGIANRPGQSAVRIRNALIMPHLPMPDTQLSNPEIDRLIAFIDSFRSDTAGPPLVPRHEQGEKPVYPDPT